MRPDLRVTLPDGTVVGYAEAGDPAGSPVLYLHGSPSSRLEVGLPGIRETAEDLGLRVVAPDRPGMGFSTFRRYSIADYPWLVRSFADALGLGRFAVIGVSGGGKYACACAWVLPDRVTRVALVSSTCSFDLPGAQSTWNAEDRRLYRSADRAPWLVRLFFAKVARDIRRDPNALFSTVERSVGAADREVLASPGFPRSARPGRGRGVPAGRTWSSVRPDPRGPALGCAARADRGADRDLAWRRRPRRVAGAGPHPGPDPATRHRTPRARRRPLLAVRPPRRRDPAVRRRRLMDTE